MSKTAKSVLIIGKVWPESRSSAAGSRMLQLIDLFIEQGFVTHFASAASQSDFSDDLSTREIDCHDIKLNDSSFDLFVKELRPTVVMFDRFMTEEQFGWRVAEQYPDAVRILDTEDLHSLRQTRQKRFKAGVPFHPASMVHEEITKRELASIYRSDLSLMISTYEMELLQNHFDLPDTILHYLPFLMDPISDSDLNKWPLFDERSGFLLIGNFLHEPNRDAVDWLKNEIWPLIRAKLSGAVLNVYGSYPSQWVLQMDNRSEGFHIHGRTEDLRGVISQARVMLAPLRFGAGLKGKLFDAMISGTPSVTSSIGAEGIADPNHWCGALSDDPKLFANEAVDLYLNKTNWNKAQKKGVSILYDGFLKKDHIPLFLNKLNHLIEDLAIHRQNQFIGSMLMHHTMASSRYMSKWIEEKEKRGSENLDL